MRTDLVILSGSDETADSTGGHHDFDGRVAACSIGGRNKLLRDDSEQCQG
jgi:hypothetical protein